ncbi:hypothetical protein [uncultured Bosea sp.]|uniref:hypothetical protein n=1 Tax=uncultured Bosea sp. TaxID=211457 RepID=UPI0025CDAFC7|nr:hypothetical protein [uncultured Bosea sp.]
MIELPAERMEWAAPGDRYADYCLWDYEPLGPTTGRLRPSTLLWHSLAAAHAPDGLVAICDTLRAGLGAGQTVWGAKHAGGTVSWELYFYDYARLSRTVSLGRIAAILSPLVSCSLRDPAQTPYFMLSLDLDTALGAGRRGIDAASLYIGNPGSAVSSGLSYALTPEGLLFDNLYAFFDARRERDAIREKIACSTYLDPSVAIDDILWPELMDCAVIVVANKRRCDGIYFSRIGVDKLLLFMERLAYPNDVIRFIRDNRSRLDHLLFDVGIDYQMVDGRLTVAKSAYYGLL